MPAAAAAISRAIDAAIATPRQVLHTLLLNAYAASDAAIDTYAMPI